MILPTLYGQTYDKRLISFYVSIYYKRFGEYPKIEYSMMLRMQMKRAFVKYGEIKVAASILFHFEQNNDRIIAEKFPIHWVFRNIEEYMTKLQTWRGVNTDDEEALYEAIKNRIEYLGVDLKL